MAVIPRNSSSFWGRYASFDNAASYFADKIYQVVSVTLKKVDNRWRWSKNQRGTAVSAGMAARRTLPITLSSLCENVEMHGVDN